MLKSSKTLYNEAVSGTEFLGWLCKAWLISLEIEPVKVLKEKPQSDFIQNKFESTLYKS